MSSNGKIRVLCLHAPGMNSQVFAAITAALRNELGDDYEWIFAEGTIPVPIDEDLKGYFPEDDKYYAYADPQDPKSVAKAMDDMIEFIRGKGPIDIVVGASGSASLTASILLRHAEENPDQPVPFSGAVFFNGYNPLNSNSLGKDDQPYLNPETHSTIISIPTANIWGANDARHAAAAKALSMFCNPALNENVTHSNGSTIPGAAAEDDLIMAAQAIRKTVSRAVPAF